MKRKEKWEKGLRLTALTSCGFRNPHLITAAGTMSLFLRVWDLSNVLHLSIRLKQFRTQEP